MKSAEIITPKLAEENPNKCANLILEKMKGKNYKDMIKVTGAYLREIKIINKLEPVRIIHLRNLIKITHKFEC